MDGTWIERPSRPLCGPLESRAFPALSQRCEQGNKRPSSAFGCLYLLVALAEDWRLKWRLKAEALKSQGATPSAQHITESCGALHSLCGGGTTTKSASDSTNTH